ncbi:hypothetical protein GPX89_00285 [Nocardia sp. ET3-3]|uniref:Mce-associated membrane protein n=1 Tax=Nocardia terrae TaxID=2675851 RepID=A0A7K1UMX2_9NOCA|nr:hypothetical protein [Nocardia terrae]MVU75680.1 hypothetical protein [Nocardia terrae]
MSQHTDAPEADTPVVESKAPAAAKTVSLKLSTLLIAAAAVVLVGALITVTVLWQSARGEVNDRNTQAANDAHAQQVATDWAVGAATINVADPNAWIAKLKTNATPELAKKWDAATPQLQQFVDILKLNSSATVLSSQVMSRDNGAYKVNVYLNTNNTNVQNPDGVLTTIYYTITVDAKNDWKVADAGGVDLRLPKQ